MGLFTMEKSSGSSLKQMGPSGESVSQEFIGKESMSHMHLTQSRLEQFVFCKWNS